MAKEECFKNHLIFVMKNVFENIFSEEMATWYHEDIKKLHTKGASKITTVLHIFDWLIFYCFLQLIFRLTPLSSVAKSNKKNSPSKYMQNYSYIGYPLNRYKYRIHQLVSRTFQETGFVYLFLCTFNEITKWISVERNCRFVVTEFVKLPDEFDKSVFLKNPMIK